METLDETRLEYALGEGPLGWLLIVGNAQGWRSCRFGATAAELQAALAREFPGATPGGAAQQALATLQDWLRHPGALPGLPPAATGTPFQRRVWQALRQIPCGQTLSYAALAARLGMPRAVRAVAGACAANPLALLVPCHRVVRSDGGLGGYRWGVARKRWLLARESGSDG